jgi:hypothetical protein
MLRLERRRLAVLVAVVAAAAPLAFATGAQAAAAGSGGSSGSDEVVATLKVTSPKVEVKKQDASVFKVAKDGAKLREGDTVRTDAAGLAEIDYGNDAYTRLDVNTEFTITKLTDEQGARQVQGSLEVGQTWNRTAAITESGSFEQEGAGANAAVRGTAFAVSCDAPDHCTFVAIEHTTALTGADGVTKDLTPRVACDSTDGDLCDATKTLSVDELAANDWIQNNLIRDLTERGVGDGPFVPVQGVLVIEEGVFESFESAPPPPPPTVPGAPKNVTAVAHDGGATVSFDPPDSDGGSAITSYTVSASAGSFGLSALTADAADVSGAGSPIEVPDLVNGVPYSFSVTATNAVGTGPSSVPSSEVTPATLPDAPSGVTAYSGYESATVMIAAPAFDGGSPVTGYTVVSTPGGELCITAFTGCTFTGLDNDTTYTFTARATNAVGTGPPSAASNAVTPPIVIPFGDTYRALIDPESSPTDWEQEVFDDSGWTDSAAPFSNDGTICSDTDFPPGASGFPSLSDVYLRKTFSLPEGASGLRVVGTVDNDAYVYVNGHLVGTPVLSGNCQADAINLAVPDEYLNVGGSNVLAVRAHDTGSDTFIDLALIYDAPPSEAAVPTSAALVLHAPAPEDRQPDAQVSVPEIEVPTDTSEAPVGEEPSLVDVAPAAVVPGEG